MELDSRNKRRVCCRAEERSKNFRFVRSFGLRLGISKPNTKLFGIWCFRPKIKYVHIWFFGTENQISNSFYKNRFFFENLYQFSC
jgi:hypothetical protein